jgi:hypothetical protein
VGYPRVWEKNGKTLAFGNTCFILWFAVPKESVSIYVRSTPHFAAVGRGTKGVEGGSLLELIERGSLCTGIETHIVS